MADQNSLTRDDTFGIRPDLFLALKRASVSRVDLDAVHEAVVDAVDRLNLVEPQVVQAQQDAAKGIEAAKDAADNLTQYRGTNDVAVNDAQNLAIQANTAALQAQGILNDRQAVWNKAATDSLEALSNSDAAQNMVLDAMADAQEQASAQVSEMTAQLRDIQQQLARKDENSILVPFNDSWSRSSKWVSTYREGGGFERYTHPTTALGNWKGILRYVRVGRETKDGPDRTITRDFPIPREDGSRTVEIAGSAYPNSLEIIVFIEPGVQKTRDLTTQAFAPPVGTWVTIPEHTFTPPAEPAESYLLFWRVKWSAATYHDFYGVRIVQGGTVLATQTLDKLGPLLPSMPGDREQWVRVPRAVLRPSVPVEFQVYSTGAEDSQRAIAWAETNLSWIE